jgi:filamentous hemagglutinin family protein
MLNRWIGKSQPRRPRQRTICGRLRSRFRAGRCDKLRAHIKRTEGLRIGRLLAIKGTGMFWFRNILGLIFFAHPLFGGVVLDGSLGTRGALPGPNYMITAPMGRQVNTNLFQSFSQFNLNSSQSATFTGPSNVRNILARVTSGGPSSIDGTVRSDIHGANLFFMNPAGVLFGQHAQLDVSGSVAVTTANYVKLVGGGRFNANLGGQDTLTSAPVSAFGFLDQMPAAVSITGSNSTRDSSGNIVPRPGLDIAPHKSFSVVAGDIAMNAGTITGRGSRVNLVSVKSPGEAQLDATAINSAVDVTQFTALGTINFTNLAVIDTNGPGGGPVVIRGGNLYLNDSQIFSETMGAIQGGAIDIALLDDLQIVNLGSIVAETVGGGKGGNLGIHAGSVSIHGTTKPLTFTGIGATSGGITVPSNADATGDAGNLTLTVGQALSIVAGGQISTTTFSRGNGGNLSIHAGSISIHGVVHGKGTPYPAGSPYPFTGIIANTGGTIGTASATNVNATGDGGNVTITVDDSLSIVAGSVIGASTFSHGNAGNLNIQAGSIFIDGLYDISGNGTGIASQSLTIPRDRHSHIVKGATGNAGDVTITVNGALSIVEGSGINCSTFTTGQGGDITIHAGSLSIDSSAAPNLFTGIAAAAYDVDNSKGSTGNAGNVTITVVHALNIFGSNGGNVRAHIFDGTQGSGPNSKRPTGHGGKLSIHAGSLSIDGGPGGSRAGISTETLGSGDAGSATVTIDGTLNIVRGGEISSSTLWKGNGGNVNVTAGSLLIDGAGTEARTGIFAEAADGSTGRGGEVTIDSDSLSLQNGGSVSALSVTSAAAGSVRLEVGMLSLESGSIVSSANTSSGPAGSVFIETIGPMQLSGGSSVSTSAIDGGAGTITVNAADLKITAGGEISSSTSGKGDGGRINVTADSLLIEGLNSQMNSETSGNGSAGDVIVHTDELRIRNQGTITATTFGGGTAGDITVHAGDVKMNDAMIEAVSHSNGAAGSIKVTSGGAIRLRDNSKITVMAKANGGNITIKAPILLSLINSEIDATAGNTGGNITIDPIVLQLKNSTINASAGHQGGQIHLFTSFLVGPKEGVTSKGVFLLAFNSSIAATGGTTNGTVNISSPELDLGAELITLPISLLSAESQLQERCTALLQGDFSSFISIGRGGTEPAPEELQTTF